MAQETKPLFAIATTAIRLMKAEHARDENLVAGQALDAMGLSPNDGWRVDLANGLAFREVQDEKPDIAPKEDSAAA